MSTETNKAVVRRYQEIYNTNTLDALSEVLAPDFVSHNLTKGTPNTIAGLKGLQAKTLAAYPDYQVSIEDLLAEGDKVTMRFVMKGTHTGSPFMDIPATGNKLEVTGISIFRLVNDKIVEHWGEVDNLGWMIQLGAIKV